MLVRLRQEENAKSSIEVTELGIETLDREVQELKVLF